MKDNPSKDQDGGIGMWVAIAAGSVICVTFVLPLAVLVAAFGGYSPSPGTTMRPPPLWIALARTASLTCHIPHGTTPGLGPVLLAIGDVESTFGSSSLPGVHYGHNSAGAEGPMQFLPSTFDSYEHPVPSDPSLTPFQFSAQAAPGGFDVGTMSNQSPYNLVDAMYAAARLLCSDGYASGLPALAVYFYNHSSRYVSEVLGLARGFEHYG
ncbi:MAG: lysozyme family protein [Acidimicrobiales bacterium]